MGRGSRDFFQQHKGRKRASKKPSGQRSRPGYLPERGPAAGPILGGWGSEGCGKSDGIHSVIVQQFSAGHLLCVSPWFWKLETQKRTSHCLCLLKADMLMEEQKLNKNN